VKPERNLGAAKPPRASPVSNLRPSRAQVTEPPYTAPYVRWCGRGERATAPPIPIENGEHRVALGALKDGKGLLLYDENGKLRVLLATNKGRTGLALYDENGKSYWSTPLQNEGR